jgi:hypothetical protein
VLLHVLGGLRLVLKGEKLTYHGEAPQAESSLPLNPNPERGDDETGMISPARNPAET